jgi:hypothetical protein
MNQSVVCPLPADYGGGEGGRGGCDNTAAHINNSQVMMMMMMMMMIDCILEDDVDGTGKFATAAASRRNTRTTATDSHLPWSLFTTGFLRLVVNYFLLDSGHSITAE